MASGLRALRKIQIGEESTKGAAVAATAALLGVLTMKNSPTIHRPVEERGQLAEFSRSVKVANLAELTFEGDATFEQILYLLHMGILGNVTPDDADPAFTWTFLPAMAAAGVFDSFTVEFGDDVEQWEVEYCLAKSIEISGAMNEPVRIRGDIFGRKMTVCNFTSSLSPPTVESILSQRARIYIDNEDGTIGTTEVSALLIAFTFTIATGLAPKRFTDGSLDFSNYAETFKGVDLRMTFAFNANAEVERLLFDGATQRLVRIVIEGSELDTADSTATTANNFNATVTEFPSSDGTVITRPGAIKLDDEQMWCWKVESNQVFVIRGYNGTAPAAHDVSVAIYNVTNKKLTLDFSGIYLDWATLSEREGEDVVEVTMSAERGANYTKLFEVVVINGVSTLP